MFNLSAPDLTRHPPRSPRVRLGGYVHLPRLLDKARAFAAGKNGEYHYDCPLDRDFFKFTRLSQKAVLNQVRKGHSDSEMLKWINARVKRTAWEIAAWSEWIESRRGPGSSVAHEAVRVWMKKSAPQRQDIWLSFHRLDVDDYVTFGGRP